MNSTDKIKVFLVDKDINFLNSLYLFLVNEKYGQIEYNLFTDEDECIRALSEKPDIIALGHFLDISDNDQQELPSFLKQINTMLPEMTVLIFCSPENIPAVKGITGMGRVEYLEKGDSAFLKIGSQINYTAKNIARLKKMQQEIRRYKTVQVLLVLILLSLFFISRVLK